MYRFIKNKETASIFVFGDFNDYMIQRDSCVIINTTLRKGQGVSEAGEQSSKVILAGTARRKFWLRAPQGRPGPPAITHRTGLQESIISIMLSQPKAKEAFDSFSPKDTITPPEEDKLDNDLQKETTVLGSIQILCCLLILSLGAILVSSPYSSHLKPAVSTMLMSGYPFLGALCFAIAGFFSIISGKKSTKPFAVSSLTSNAVSSVVAVTGLILLADSLVALGSASQLCGSQREHLTSLPNSEYDYPTYKVEGCVLDSVSLTGVLVVMFFFTVLELLLAAYASVFWWKEVYSGNPGSSFSLPQSQDYIKHVKDFFKVMDVRTLSLREKKKEKPSAQGKV
ncbi:membrane-spanning 4-domains subfamily A member 7 [Desmodus rotundus]|uniref:membrane-spanning 4-domains subfamily A member 7 n=1 Tax=Desmodus rotundus TaxID=9430 RepID=UPI0023818A67|nr:membrane-spanning 4-domains subfamily A member 7 [Desmodus rotundus]